MSLNLEAADILLAARDDIGRPNGWLQRGIGAYGARDGAVCAIAALRRQNFVYGCSDDAMEAAQAALSRQVGRGVSIGSWNDDPERTVDEVMAAMDAAAAELKGRG